MITPKKGMAMMRKKWISNRYVDWNHIYNSTNNLNMSADVVVIIVVIVADSIVIFTPIFPDNLGDHVTASLLNTSKLSLVF